MVITIDGPVASGKSSTAKILAQKLNFFYLYTGLLYRAVAYILQTNPDNNFEFIKDIRYEHINKEPRIFFKDCDITDHLFNKNLDQPASIISANANVRSMLLDLQRNVAKKYDIVAEGRDCGTVVFPDAAHKFYFTASLDVRAHRVINDARRKSSDMSLEEAKREVQERDERDSKREIAPLKKPKDAIEIDTSELSVEETASVCLSKIKLVVLK